MINKGVTMNEQDRRYAESYRKTSIHKANKHSKQSRRDADIKQFGFHVTDHAVVRYLERVKKEDIENIRVRQIVSDNDARYEVTHHTKNSDKRIYLNGYQLRVKNKTVVTDI